MRPNEIYREDAVLEYPQSGERIRPTQHPGVAWITELVMTYDDQPSYVVSIMEFDGAVVVRETPYSSDPFERHHLALSGSNRCRKGALETPELSY